MLINVNWNIYLDSLQNIWPSKYVTYFDIWNSFYVRTY